MITFNFLKPHYKSWFVEDLNYNLNEIDHKCAACKVKLILNPGFDSSASAADPATNLQFEVSIISRGELLPRVRRQRDESQMVNLV